MLNKRVVISIFLIISLIAVIGFVLACSGRFDRNDNPINGVKIGGDCYDCDDTNSDGICPNDFQANNYVCKFMDDIDCDTDNNDIMDPYDNDNDGDGWTDEVEKKRGTNPNDPEDYPTTKVYWAGDDGVTELDELHVDMLEGAEIKMAGLVSGNGDVDIELYEEDYLFNDGPLMAGDDYIKIITGTITNGELIGIYIIRDNHEEDIKGDGGDGDSDGIYELYFIVNGEKSNILEVTYSIGGGPGIESCGDYDNPTDCEDDPEKVGNLGVKSPVERPEGTECFYHRTGECKWDNGCYKTITEIADEGNEDEEKECDAALGECQYTEGQKIGSCETEDFIQIVYTSTDPSCEEWTSEPIPCPRELKVPFFGIYGFITSIFAICMIYFFLKRREIKDVK